MGEGGREGREIGERGKEWGGGREIGEMGEGGREVGRWGGRWGGGGGR